MLSFLKRLFDRKSSPDPIALVSLETEPRVLTKGHVAQAVSKALGHPFSESEIAEEGPSYHRLTVEGYELTVVARSGPYIPKDGPPHQDLRLRDAIDRHRAAILIDCWKAPAGHERAEAVDAMGKILAELFDETSLAVFCFHTQRLNLVDENLVPMFQEGHALEAMQGITFDPVGDFGNDARMDAAIEEARRQWPRFEAAFAERTGQEEAPYIVKIRFGEGEKSEHMWVEVHEIEGDLIKGVLLNEPFYLARPKKGQIVTMPQENVSDWAYPAENGVEGLFTEAIARGG